jgi:hypothetical protein
VTHSELHAFCLEWVTWLRTRKLLGPPPPPPTIMGRMQPHHIRRSPDGPMSAELAMFDLAVRAMPDSTRKLAFLAFYRHPRFGPIKKLAHDMGVSRTTFYQWVKEARVEAYDLSQRLRDAQASQARESDQRD